MENPAAPVAPAPSAPVAPTPVAPAPAPVSVQDTFAMPSPDQGGQDISNEPSVATPAKPAKAQEKGAFMDSVKKMFDTVDPEKVASNKNNDTQQPVDTQQKPQQPDPTDEEGKRAEEDIRRETTQMSPAQKQAFTKLRYELRDKNRQLSRAQTDAGAIKDDPNSLLTPNPEVAKVVTELEQLKQEKQQLESRLEKFDTEFLASRVELTKEYESAVVVPRGQLAEKIGELTSKYDGINTDLIVEAVRSGNPKSIELASAEMSDFDRYKFYQLAESYQEVVSVERQMRENARGTLTKIERTRAEAEASSKKSETEAWEQAKPKAWDKLVETFPVLAPIDGEDSWNNAVGTIKEFASPTRFSEMGVNERAEVLYRAAAFPVLIAELEAARKEAASAKTSVAKFQGASPSLDTRSGAGKSGGPGGENITAAMARLMREAGM